LIFKALNINNKHLLIIIVYGQLWGVKTNPLHWRQRRGLDVDMVRSDWTG